jgi:predicted ATPase
MRDGSGLTSTLHALQNLRKGGPRRLSSRLRRANRSTLDEIVDWSKLVFPNLSDILVAQDPHTGKYLANLVLGDEKPLKLPLQSASDGTLKWLSLVTLITASGGLYSIEEPENFLHPKMLEYLVDLVRESYRPLRFGSYFIFSTHSETLVNYCHPSELVIFDFIDNATVCSRVSNPHETLEKINQTGFGLGYYYANNSLPTHPRVRRRNNGEIISK